MDDSFEKELESIKAEIPTRIKADPIALLYGVMFALLGFMLMEMDEEILGYFMIAVGAIGVLAGGATFFWKSPVVKIIQAVDDLLIAFMLLGLLMVDTSGNELFDNPVIPLVGAAFMIWVAFEDVKEYWQIKKVLAEQKSAE